MALNRVVIHWTEQPFEQTFERAKTPAVGLTPGWLRSRPVRGGAWEGVAAPRAGVPRAGYTEGSP
jgi:hypothetical protein